MLTAIPHSFAQLDPKVFLISLLSLLILFGVPLIKAKWVRKVPTPMLVLMLALPLGYFFDLRNGHTYSLLSHAFDFGLIRFPEALFGALSFPDFSQSLSVISIKYSLMIALFGSIQSLLSVMAVDSLDPEKRSSDLNRDLLAVGAGNTIVALIGGLPMISGIIGSKVNIDNGAKSAWSNFFHGLFLLLSVALIPGLLQQIPLAALAAILIYTGVRLSLEDFKHVSRMRREPLLLFGVTMLVTLMTDLLVGVFTALALKAMLHFQNSTPLFKYLNLYGHKPAFIYEKRDGSTLTLEVRNAGVRSFFPALTERLKSLDASVRYVVVDFQNAQVIRSSELYELHMLANRWTDRELELVGLDNNI